MRYMHTYPVRHAVVWYAGMPYAVHAHLHLCSTACGTCTPVQHGKGYMHTSTQYGMRYIRTSMNAHTGPADPAT